MLKLNTQIQATQEILEKIVSSSEKPKTAKKAENVKVFRMNDGVIVLVKKTDKNLHQKTSLGKIELEEKTASGRNKKQTQWKIVKVNNLVHYEIEFFKSDTTFETILENKKSLERIEAGLPLWEVFQIVDEEGNNLLKNSALYNNEGKAKVSISGTDEKKELKIYRSICVTMLGDKVRLASGTSVVKGGFTYSPIMGGIDEINEMLGEIAKYSESLERSNNLFGIENPE